MIPDWLIALMLVFMWLHGFVTAWAISHEDDPIWSAFLTVSTFGMFAKDEPEIEVTPSCGCVFCDIGLKPDADGWHRAKDYESACRTTIQ